MRNCGATGNSQRDLLPVLSEIRDLMETTRDYLLVVMVLLVVIVSVPVLYALFGMKRPSQKLQVDETEDF
jgi:hypothetical protein